MGYTIAKSLGMKTRELEELIPADKLEMLAPIMKHWAGKLYESFDGDIDKEKIEEHIRWIYTSNKYQYPHIVYTYNPEVYKSLVAEILINGRDVPVEINMRSYLTKMVRPPIWLSVNTESEITYIERFQSSIKNIISGLPYRNSAEFRPFVSHANDSTQSRSLSDSSESLNGAFLLNWFRNAQLNKSRNAQLKQMFNGSGLWADSAWFFLFDYISAIGVRKSEFIDEYKDFLHSGVFASMFFEKHAVILIQPQFVKMTANSQFHCDGGAAIEWRDGHKTYLLHNVLTPEYLAVTPYVPVT
ncbi:hypothetical protein [Candidatus Magnetomonas plexicatena]|uniref:hypothetical protein n=1 Tax=Candidatus Magnetomonas plexicatena TaxID=2552947 RepID=UPI0011005530|nr:hypothetical protein E2O03_007490 [Nitrospirales bacterium LBB_01]